MLLAHLSTLAAVVSGAPSSGAMVPVFLPSDGDISAGEINSTAHLTVLSLGHPNQHLEERDGTNNLAEWARATFQVPESGNWFVAPLGTQKNVACGHWVQNAYFTHERQTYLAFQFKCKALFWYPDAMGFHDIASLAIGNYKTDGFAAVWFLDDGPQ